MDKFKVDKTDLFKKLVKRLSKKYRNIECDIDDFLNNISKIEHLGDSLGKNLTKRELKIVILRRVKAVVTD